MADRRGRIAYWSAGATDLFGYTAESMVGKAVSVLGRHRAGAATPQGFARRGQRASSSRPAR
jgi:PAS domain S-box-containing protein